MAKRKYNIKSFLLLFLFISFIAISIFSFKEYEKHLAESIVNNYIKEISDSLNGSVSIRYEKADISIIDSELKANDIEFYKGQENQVIVSNIAVSLDNIRNTEKIPENGKIEINGIKFKSNSLIEDIKIKTGIDYSGKSIDVKSSYSIVKNENVLYIHFTISSEELNQLSLYISLDNVNNFWEEAQGLYQKNASFTFSDEEINELLISLENASLRVAKLKYINKGEIDKLIKQAANNSKVNENKIKSLFAATAMKNFGKTDLTNDIKKFIYDPQNLTIIAEPKNTIKVSELPIILMGIKLGRYDHAINLLDMKLFVNK